MGMLRKGLRLILETAGYQIVRTGTTAAYRLPPDFSPDVVRTIEAVQPFTMTTPERIEALIHSVDYVARNDIPGDIVECGVWRGGSMMAVAHTLLRVNRKDKVLYLFDTFAGMPPAGDVDRTFRGESAAELMKAGDSSTSWIWAVARLEDVRNNLNSTGYPPQQIRYIEGKVENTIPENAPEQIAILRLDTDWYESTKHELLHLFPRLAPGGVLIIDDYGHWMGARKAVDEYLERNRISLLLNRIDYTGRIGVKVGR